MLSKARKSLEHVFCFRSAEKRLGVEMMNKKKCNKSYWDDQFLLSLKKHAWGNLIALLMESIERKEQGILFRVSSSKDIESCLPKASP